MLFSTKKEQILPCMLKTQRIKKNSATVTEIEIATLFFHIALSIGFIVMKTFFFCFVRHNIFKKGEICPEIDTNVQANFQPTVSIWNRFVQTVNQSTNVSHALFQTASIKQDVSMETSSVSPDNIQVLAVKFWREKFVVAYSTDDLSLFWQNVK